MIKIFWAEGELRTASACVEIVWHIEIDTLHANIQLMRSKPHSHKSILHNTLHKCLKALVASSHLSLSIDQNAYDSSAPFEMYLIKRFRQIIEHRHNIVEIFHQNRKKMEVLQSIIPAELQSHVAAAYCHIRGHVQSNRKFPGDPHYLI